MVIQMSNGAELQIYVDQESVTATQLPDVLKEKEDGWDHGGAPVVLLQMGKHITIEQRASVMNELLKRGFDVHEVGKLKGTDR